MMAKKRILAVLSIVAILLAATLAGCSSSGPAPADQGKSDTKAPSEIKIGFVTDLSVGGATEQGVATRQGFELAVKEFNAAGGYNGTPVKLITYDDEAKPEKAVELVTRLINQDKVLAIAGFVNSGNALASEQLTQDAKVPMLVNFATATAITTKFQDQPKNYIFRYSLLDSEQVSIILDWAKTKNFKKIAILHDTSGYGVSGKEDVLKQMAARGMKAAAIDTLNVNDTDMTPQLQKFKKAGIDAVFLYNLSPENANVIRSAQKIDYKPTFFGSWSISFGTFKRLAGDLRNGVYTSTSYVVGQTEKSKALHDKMVKEYSDDTLPIASAFGYDSANLLLQALKTAGPNSEKIRDALENMESFDGAVGKINKPFSPKDHEGIGLDQIFMAVWENGELKKVK